MGIKVGSAAFLVTFAGFSCHGVRKIRVAELRDADFVVEMSQKSWDSFLKGRTSGKGVTLAELDNVDGVIKAINPRKNLDFLRYHLSLQAFIDAGARAA